MMTLSGALVRCNFTDYWPIGTKPVVRPGWGSSLSEKKRSANSEAMNDA